MRAARATAGNPAALLLPAVVAVAAVGVGAAGVVAAYLGQPLLVPGLMAMGVLAGVVVSRPAIGVAIAFVLAPLNAGLAGSRAWVPAAAWIGLLLLVVVAGPHGRVGSLRWGPPLRSEGRSAPPLRSEGRSDPGRFPPLGPAVIAFAAVTVASVVQAARLGDTASFLRSTATGMGLFFVCAVVLRTRRQVEWAIGGAVAGGAVIGLFAVSEYLGGGASPVGFITAGGQLIPRATAGFGQPNQLGGFLALVVPLALAGALVFRRGRGAYLLAAVVAAVGVYATFSRAALVALAVVPLIVLRRAWLWLSVAALGLILVVATPTLLRERFAAGAGGGAEISARADFWRAAVHVWSEHPLLGVGPGQFADAYAGARVPSGKNFLEDTSFEPPPHAHNVELNLLAEQGLIGFVAFAAVVAVAVRASIRLRRSDDRWTSTVGSGLLAALAVLAVHNQFDVTLVEGTGIYFWGFLGILSALTSMQVGRPPVGKGVGSASRQPVDAV